MRILNQTAEKLTDTITAIHGYSELLEQEELSDSARLILKKLKQQSDRTSEMLSNFVAAQRLCAIGEVETETPIAVSSLPETEQPASPSLPMPLPRALIIGRDDAVLQFQRSALRASGLVVEVENSAEASLSRLTASRFGLILIDAESLPQAGIREFYSWLAQNRPALLARTLIIMPSQPAKADPDWGKSGLRCLKRPLDLMELMGSVQGAMNLDMQAPDGFAQA